MITKYFHPPGESKEGLYINEGQREVLTRVRNGTLVMF
jgi:hypothetical protein